MAIDYHYPQAGIVLHKDEEWTRFHERYGLVASDLELAPDCEERTIGEMAEAYQRLLWEIPQRDTIEVDLPDF